MLVELSVMEQRYQAVLAVVQDGWQVAEVARRLGVSERACLDRSLRAGRACRARGPIAPPELLPAPDHRRDRSSDLRVAQRAPGVGTTTDRAPARTLGDRPRPSRSAIYRCLRRHGLVELRRRRKRRDEFRRWEREHPMQLRRSDSWRP